MLVLQLLIALCYSTVVDCDLWSSWDSWGSCSLSCGYGIKSRYIGSYYSEYASSYIQIPHQNTYCNTQACPVNGGWGGWSGWSSCPVTCGGGTRTRSRPCNNPSPSNGGSSCCGLSSESQDCNVDHCPVNGNWSPWTSTGICSSTCGGGLSPNIRQCNDPWPAYGGLVCSGYHVVNRSCNTQHCPVNGHWGDWGNWTVCNTTCDDGYQNRTRECDNPTPLYGGLFCPDSGYEIRECRVGPCVAQIQDERGIAAGIVAIIAVSSSLLTAITLIMINIIRHRKTESSKAKIDDQTAYHAEDGGTLKTKAFDNKEYCSFKEDTNEISLPPRRMRSKDQLSTKNKIVKRISTIYENLKIM